MRGMSHVFPPGYRNGLRCGTDATLTTCSEGGIFHIVIWRPGSERRTDDLRVGGVLVVQLLVYFVLQDFNELVNVTCFRPGDLLQTLVELRVHRLPALQRVDVLGGVLHKVVDKPCDVRFGRFDFLQVWQGLEEATIERHGRLLVPRLEYPALEDQLRGKPLARRRQIIGVGVVRMLAPIHRRSSLGIFHVVLKGIAHVAGDIDRLHFERAKSVTFPLSL